MRGGRELALQQGFYTSRMHQTTQIILAKKDEQYESIRAAILDRARKFSGIVFLVRVSPPANSQATPEETSLDTQKMFLLQFFETSFRLRATCISLPGVSAYSDDVLDAIESHLNELHGSQLIVALSVDRVTRKESHLVRLRQILEHGQHQICSLVWQQNSFDSKDTQHQLFINTIFDTSTNGEPQYKNLLERHLQIVDHAMPRPVVWPMLWFTSSINPIVVNEVRQAERFVKEMHTSSWQGDPKISIDSRLASQDAALGLSAARCEAVLCGSIKPTAK